VCTRGSDRALLRGPSTSPLGVMRPKTLAWVVTVAALAALALVVVPAFPEPVELLSLDYSGLQARLGPPTVVFPDKFVGWSRSRFVATWTLEVGVDFPLRPQSRARSVSRCLWVEWAGYRLLCNFAIPGRVQILGSPHDS
jgi:hypothetical protein